MEQERDGAEPLTAVVAARVKEVRRKRGWSAERLAAEMAKVGVPWTRMVVTKLETGRRPSVSLTEVLALAYVLGVAPIHLIVPTEGDAPYPVTPEWVVKPARAREWIRGRHPLPSTDPRIFFSEVPAYEWEPPPMTEQDVKRQALLLKARRQLKGEDE